MVSTSMQRDHKISLRRVIETVGADLYRSILISFRRFQTRTDTVADNLNIIEAAHRLKSIHPSGDDRNFLTNNTVFGPCNLLSYCSYEPWVTLRREAQTALALVGCEDAKRIVSLLWHADALQKSSETQKEDEIAILVEQACEVCREAIERAGPPLGSARTNMDAMRAIIRADV